MYTQYTQVSITDFIYIATGIQGNIEKHVGNEPSMMMIDSLTVQTHKQ